jgi:hypothetical protein
VFLMKLIPSELLQELSFRTMCSMSAEAIYFYHLAGEPTGIQIHPDASIHINIFNV